MCRFVAVFSCSENGIFGDAIANDLVLKDKRDLAHFASTTKDGVVVMGRKTIESLPKKLSNRLTICLTRDESYTTDKADVVLTSKQDVIDFAHRTGKPDVFVCGGAQIYELFDDAVDKIIVTHFNQQVEVDCPVEVPQAIGEFIRHWPSTTLESNDTFTVKAYKRPVTLPSTILKYPDAFMVSNAIITPDGTRICSLHRHDFQSHTDANGKTYSVDGGISYSRILGDNDYKSDIIYTDDHMVARWHITWGTMGKNGDEELTYIPVATMTTAHLEAVLDLFGKTLHPTIKTVMMYEMLFRLTRD